LAPVRGRPMLDWVLLAVARAGLNRAILATGYQADSIRHLYQPGRHFGVDVVHSQEAQPLGTGGALRRAAGLASTGTLLVLNGDTLVHFNLPEMRKLHQSRHAAVTLWLARVTEDHRFGLVKVDSEGKVLAFREKVSDVVSGPVSAGVYLVQREMALGIALTASLEVDVFPALVGRNLWAVVGDDDFVDIGTPGSLANADRLFGSELDELESLECKLN
jgi:NDP-sugar pyrophosphorylase family protein